MNNCKQSEINESKSFSVEPVKSKWIEDSDSDSDSDDNVDTTSKTAIEGSSGPKVSKLDILLADTRQPEFIKSKRDFEIPSFTKNIDTAKNDTTKNNVEEDDDDDIVASRVKLAYIQQPDVAMMTMPSMDPVCTQKRACNTNKNEDSRLTAKDRVKRQRLSGQSGIGSDFRTWKSDEEMRQRQQYD